MKFNPNEWAMWIYPAEIFKLEAKSVKSVGVDFKHAFKNIFIFLFFFHIFKLSKRILN